LILHHEDVIARTGDVADAASGDVWMTLNDVSGGRVVDGSDRIATIARTTNRGWTWSESATLANSYQ
jgi:hypothetical protein